MTKLRKPRNCRRQRVPHWPMDREHASVRVLVEHPDPLAQHILAVGLRELGYEVVTCGGPTAEGLTKVSCPVLRQEACPAVDGADVIVSSLPIGGPEGIIVRRIAKDPGAPPIVLEATTWQISQYLEDVVAACSVYPLSVEVAANAVSEVLPNRIPARR
jgi:hypothetical protein